MVRTMLVVVALVACSDKQPDPPAPTPAKSTFTATATPAEVRASCEAVRDTYFAWRVKLMDRIMEPSPGQIEEAKRGLEEAKPGFVEMCTKLGIVIDASCFEVELVKIEDKDKRQRCTTTINELAAGVAREETKPATEVHDAGCEALRDKYIAWSTARAKSALAGGVAGAHTAELQAEADKEMAIAKTKFVGVCVAMGSSLDGSCFEIERGMSRDREKQRRCMKIVNELEGKLFAR